jgi:predicted transposase YbfD/YdcC
MDHGAETNSLLGHFAVLKDPRQLAKVLYPLPEVLLLVLCATLAGADDFVEIEEWGKTRLEFLRRFLAYERGIPSHDALNDLINAMDPAAFSESFVSWVEGLSESDPDIVAIDGKTSRRTHAQAKGRNALHMVSAWASRQRLVLGQEATDAKSNEITAIPLLLQRLELKGALVTIDAMGCQSKIAAAILAREADYLLTVKDNQPTLHDDLRRYFADAPAEELNTFQTTDGDHGRMRSTATSSASRSTGSLTAASTASRPSPWSNAPSRATAKPHANATTTSVPLPSSQPCSPTRCAVIGISRTASTGSSTSSSARTFPASAPATVPRTWPSSGTWP